MKTNEDVFKILIGEGFNTEEISVFETYSPTGFY
jgi:hypothetical protein